MPEKAVEQVEGGSIAGLLKNEGKGAVSRPREELVFHFPHYQSGDGPHTTIMAGKHKLMHFWESDTSKLFNLDDDVREKKDLSGEQAELAKELQERMKKYLVDIDAQMARPNPNYDPDVASQTISRPCLLYTSPSPRDKRQSRMPSSA